MCVCKFINDFDTVYNNIFLIHYIDSIIPRAHTCFSKLDLPVYDSKNEMQAYLSLVINLEVSGGFSME